MSVLGPRKIMLVHRILVHRIAKSAMAGLGTRLGMGLGAVFVLSGLPCHSAMAQQQTGVPGLVVSMPPPSGPPSSVPGLVVSTPPTTGTPAPAPGMPGLVIGPSRGPAQPSQTAPAQGPAQGPAPVATAKPKPKSPPKKTAAASPPVAAGKGGQGIAALVNDEPVTAFEVDNLARFMALSTNIGDRAKANMQAIAQNPATNDRLKAILQETIQANPGKSREQVIAAFEERKKQFVISLQKQAVESARSSVIPTLRKKALDELVDDRLKSQEAKRLNLTVGDDDVERAFKGIAERNKVSLQDFTNNIKAQGADPAVMKQRLRSQIIWREVIRRRFGHTIAISHKEVDKVVANAASTGEDLSELQLHKVTFATTGKIDQKVIAQRYDEADKLRAKFGGCKSTAALVKDKADAKFEDLGYRKASSISEPARTLLLAARDGEMIPPNPTGPASNSMPSADGAPSRSTIRSGRLPRANCSRRSSTGWRNATSSTCVRTP